MTEQGAVMPGQTSLLDGEALRDEGMARVSEGEARQAWLARGVDVIEQIGTGTVFSADDLHDEIGEPPHPNLWGPLFNRAKAEGLIRVTGYAPSYRRSRHAALTRLWLRLP